MRYRYPAVAAAAAMVTVLAIWSGIASAQGGSAAQVAKRPTTGAHSAAAVRTAHVRPNGTKLLYSQYDNASGIITSQDFEVPFSTFDAQAADDFTVPTGQTWNVTQLDVAGAENNPVAEAEVILYSDAGGPSNILAIRNTHNVIDTSGALTIHFPAITLSPGTYWVGVTGTLDFTFHGQWYAGLRDVVNGSPAEWTNPGNGFNTGCTTFQPILTCLGATRDIMFDLRGHLAV
jgi:hypothetical protein